MKTGPIIIVEDDEDDYEILKEVVSELKYINDVIWFENCAAAWLYLKDTNTSPFVILCDINLPKQSGLAFKRQIDSDPALRRKSIPFVFHSTAAEQDTINTAYIELSVQGFFQKAHSYQQIKANIKMILEYWGNSLHPNT